MAYLRWSYSDWYVYWMASHAERKDDEQLWIGHFAFDKYKPVVFDYDRVKEAIDGNWEGIPGYKDIYHKELLGAFEEFIEDIDEEWERRK